MVCTCALYLLPTGKLEGTIKETCLFSLAIDCKNPRAVPSASFKKITPIKLETGILLEIQVTV